MTLGYSGITLASVLWKSYFELLRDHSGQCAVEGLLWATQGSLWPVWKSYFGLLRDHFGKCAVEELSWATQGSLWPVWKSYFGLLRDHFGQCAVEELSWATGRTEVQSSKNLTTPQSYGWGTKENTPHTHTHQQTLKPNQTHTKDLSFCLEMPTLRNFSKRILRLLRGLFL